MWFAFLGADPVTSFREKSAIVESTGSARLAAYVFIGSMIAVGALFKSQVGGEACSSFWGYAVGLVLSAILLVMAACYVFYLSIGSVQAKRFPAPGAHVPIDCEVAEGNKALAYGVIMAMTGIALLAFAVLVAMMAVSCWPK